MITFLALWWLRHRDRIFVPDGYVLVSDEYLRGCAAGERELDMFKRHLSHRWQVRIRNRDRQERALENLQQLGLYNEDFEVHDDADLTPAEVETLGGVADG